jgi:ABC-type sugar transport system ATPase subunit
MLDKPIWENIVQVRSVGLARDGALLATARRRQRAARLAEQVGVKSPSVRLAAGSLSGGNQQKVVLAKWLDCSPALLLLDDPTRGVDIGARAEINRLLHAMAAGGAISLYLSTDLEEMVTSCDRVLVFHRGRICGELYGSALTAPAPSQMMNTGAMPATGVPA